MEVLEGFLAGVLAGVLAKVRVEILAGVLGGIRVEVFAEVRVEVLAEVLAGVPEEVLVRADAPGSGRRSARSCRKAHAPRADSREGVRQGSYKLCTEYFKMPRL